MPDYAALFLDSIHQAGDRLGIAVAGLGDEQRLYTAERLEHLSTTVGQPGHLESARREALNIVGRAAGRVVTAADAADAELIGFATGGLLFLARLIAPGP